MIQDDILHKIIPPAFYIQNEKNDEDLRKIKITLEEKNRINVTPHVETNTQHSNTENRGI